MSRQDLAGKIVLVTGGARNVGKAIATRFAMRGAHVIINFFHSLEESKRTAFELRALGAEVDVIRASVAQQSQVDRMFDEIETKFGRLDILVNNAASGALLGVDDIANEHFDRALNTNLKGAFWCARRAAGLIGRSGGGAIVNVSSVGATLVPANYLVVGTSKAALESLTRYLAVEYAPQNIRVNAASATLVDGEVADQFPDPENTKRSSIAASPLRRLATGDDIAEVVLFLASDAASWITGQVVVADGGLSLCSEGLSPRPQWRDTETPAAPPILQLQRPAIPAAAPDEGPESDDIAIVGMGVALPGANDLDGFWRALTEGPELFGDVPADRWDFRSFYSPDPAAEDKSYQSRSVFITGFAPGARQSAELTDASGPQELTTQWLRHSLLQALAGVTVRPGDRTSFLVGYTADGSQHLEEAMVLAGVRARLRAALDTAELSAAERQRCLEQADEVLTARYHRGASGFAEFFPHRVGLEAMRGVLPDDAECMMVDTACSSSLYSVDLGMKSLLLGQKDVAVCGGAFALAPRGSVLFSKLHGLSRCGEVRPLDKACDGVLFADGAGVVVLKRLRRALADGDTVHGVIKGFGFSSDGKGKAIYAPSSEGQNIAIRRAYSSSGVAIGDIDWVVAHATGTPAGDLAEFQSLSAMFAGPAVVQVTSNKSLIGHTGWAAGVASLVQTVLALRHGVIPPQHRFSEAPAEFKLEQSSLRIPTQPVPWPARTDRPRIAAISGFGFGGTNGHLIVSEYRAGLPAAPARVRQPAAKLVIVGWSARLPGLENDAAVRDWLLDHGAAPKESFGDSYPLPPFDRVRMPPAVLRVLDRCQLMALDAAHELREQLRGFWDAHADTIGVVMGHMGPTRNATLYASRLYLDDIDMALDGAAGAGPLRGALATMRKQTRRLVAATTENSFPGMMPNVIPARVANYFDLHGCNMTVDAGRASALAAFEVAARTLRSGELDMVLVGGINGNTAEEILPALELPPAEGVVLFAMMTAEAAEAAGLPALAVVDPVDAGAVSPLPLVPFRDCAGRAITFLGADAAFAVLRAMLAGAPDCIVGAANDRDRDRFALRVAAPVADAVSAEPVVAGSTVEETVPPALLRYRLTLRDEAWQRGSDPLAFLPAGCVLVTDCPSLLHELAALPDDLVVLSTEPLPHPRAGWHHIAAGSTALPAGLLPVDRRHVRLLTIMHAAELTPGKVAIATPARLALHDLSFLAIKQCYGALADGGSLIALLLDAVTHDVPHPDAGLFSGLVKAMGVELPSCRSLAVLTTSASVGEGAAQAERESGAAQLLPVVVLAGERRRTPHVEQASAGPADAAATLRPGSVVVAVGGARGITAEAMKALAQQIRPTLYLIGSSDLDGAPADIFEGSDDEFLKRRPDYIRAARAADPALKLPRINRDFERLVETRAARANLRAMAAHCGTDRVHYLRADVLDEASVRRAVGWILEREQHVDLLVNAAGLSRTASVPVKSFADFVAVRDIKVRGTWNLRAAFGDRQPRAWCNYGSFIGLTGQSGETDYASGNDFLNTQAAYHRAACGADEFTIGWTLWRSVGMGANKVTAAFLEKSGLFTGMRTEEGVAHFLSELGMARRDAASVHLGDNERRAIQAHLPTFFDQQPAVAPGREMTGFYLGRTVRRDAESVLFERVFDLKTDAYLAHHMVNGFATLPGTFVPEIAAEAAQALLPGRVVAGFKDVVFHHFLRVYDASRPGTKRIEATLIRRNGASALVQVRVSGDVAAPTGQILVRDKLHFEAKVMLADAYAPAPLWPSWPETPSTDIADPYHFDAAAVHLSDMFVSTAGTRITPAGKRARFSPAVAADDPVFSRFIVPSILLDGLARIAVLNIVAGDYIPLAAPASIRRIDIYEAGNDCTLPQRYDRIELYATPREFALEGPDLRNRFVAARPDGRMVLQMNDVTGVIIGYVHRLTGAFASKAEIDALLAPAGALTPQNVA